MPLWVRALKEANQSHLSLVPYPLSSLIALLALKQNAPVKNKQFILDLIEINNVSFSLVDIVHLFLWNRLQCMQRRFARKNE